MNWRVLILLFSFSYVISACSVFKSGTAELDDLYATVELDTVDISGKVHDYQETPLLENRILHTRLEVSFDWENRYLNGKAELTVTPHFYPVNKLTLDAKGFDMHQVQLITNERVIRPEYAYDSLLLTIFLDTFYTRNDTFSVLIDYTAKPYEMDATGSRAISFARGLYFINHLGDNPYVPQQIWTQGQTESNSRWFPTIDKPNQRMTQELFITVDDRFKTLSNGLLIFSEKHADGKRTDYWKQSLPHAPYLVMMAVGEYAVVSDTWEGIGVDYYVYPEYEQYARDIFGNTPEMITYFSELFGVKYPWEKYDQVIVHNFVAGAMENTTANVFFENAQRTRRELADWDMERVVAHELVHHWFGNLLTCKSWSNLTLNEGFATYGEFLWSDFKYGKDEGDYVVFRNLQAYIREARSRLNSLIRFQYEQREDMFDSHSYQKGALVLHMLRAKLGDEAFFAGIQHYLETNALKSVDIQDLRLSMEDVSGIDMNPFFNQWFLSAGHPLLEVTYNFDSLENALKIAVEQKQDFFADIPVFQFNVDVKVVHQNGEHEVKTFKVNRIQNAFEWEMNQKPLTIIFNPESVLLAEVTERRKTPEMRWQQYLHASNVRHRLRALQVLFHDAERVLELFTWEELSQSLNDDFWAVREYAVQHIPMPLFAADSLLFFKTLVSILETDTKNQVRKAALERVYDHWPQSVSVLVVKNYVDDNSYIVQSAALKALVKIEPNAANTFALEHMLEAYNSDLVFAIAEVFTETFDLQANSFFEKQLKALDMRRKPFMITHYSNYLAGNSPEMVRNALPVLKQLTLNDENRWVRENAARAIKHILNVNRYRASGETLSGDAAYYKVDYATEDADRVVQMVTNIIDKIRESTDERGILNALRD